MSAGCYFYFFPTRENHFLLRESITGKLVFGRAELFLVFVLVGEGVGRAGGKRQRRVG